MSERLFHILIKPDAFIRGIVFDVIKYLCGFYDVKIYSANIIEPNDKLLDIMYNNFKWEYDYIDHNRQLYKFGPSLSLVCGTGYNGTFKDIKGETLPMNNSCNNSVRSKFGAVDRSINIIHIADNFEDSRREINQIYRSDCEKCGELMEMSMEQIQNVIKQSRVFYEYPGVVNVIEQRILNFFNSINKLSNHSCMNTIMVRNDRMKEFTQLYESLNRIKESTKNDDLGKELKVLSFFHRCARNCNFYVSEFELYVLYSQAYYHDVNRLA